jgi:hypothetical protein
MKNYFLAFSLFAVTAARAEIITADSASLAARLRGLRAGDELRLSPGDYPGGQYLAGLDDLTIEAADAQHPPHFQGGATGWHFSRCQRLTLRHLKFSGQSINGLNLDDGGSAGQRVAGITLENLEVSDIGPQGNHDAIKCSGLESLTVRGCRLSGWGGQGIDLVGCHRSLITDCEFIGKAGFRATAGIQMKGGSSRIVVEKCRFENAAERPLNVGGSTGEAFFRPQGAPHEAADITVRDCVIEGGLCAAAFVGVDGAEFTRNTLLFPKKWVFRILQESSGPRFTPCRNVRITENNIIFRRAEVGVEVNIGGGTSPDTFVFEKNRWFAEDEPSRSRPKLPVVESGGSYGVDPR